jgi:hypothetical protein
MNTSYDEPRHHIVLSEKRNIAGVEDKTDMLANYGNFDEIQPFTVKTDPSIPLNNEDVIRPFCITILCHNLLLFIDIFHI